jgi:hypothetical protein
VLGLIRTLSNSGGGEVVKQAVVELLEELGERARPDTARLPAPRLQDFGVALPSSSKRQLRHPTPTSSSRPRTRLSTPYPTKQRNLAMFTISEESKVRSEPHHPWTANILIHI